MNQSRSPSKFGPRLAFAITLLILVGLLVWSVFESRRAFSAAIEHAKLQDEEKKQLQQLKDKESWDDIRSQAVRDDEAEYRILPRVHKACFSKEDFFPLHPGEYCAYSFGRPTDLIRKKWFYLPQGNHKFYVSVVRADSRSGRTPQITEANFRAKVQEKKADLLSEHKFELEGGKVHEFEMKRDVQDEGQFVVASLNGEVLATTEIDSATERSSISTFFYQAKRIPHRIRDCRQNNSGVFSLEPQDIDASEVEFVLNQNERDPHAVRLFDTHCRPAYVFCFASIEFGGGPRANFVDGNWNYSFSSFGPPFSEELWFEYRDGLYFLKEEVNSRYEEPSDNY